MAPMVMLHPLAVRDSTGLPISSNALVSLKVLLPPTRTPSGAVGLVGSNPALFAGCAERLRDMLGFSSSFHLKAEASPLMMMLTSPFLFSLSMDCREIQIHTTATSQKDHTI
jgi:hypothetical protein